MILPAGWSLAAKLAAPLLVVGAAAALIWGYGHRQYLRGEADVRAEISAQVQAAERENARIERHRFRMAQEVQDAYAKNAARDRALAAAARAERDGLFFALDELAASRPTGDAGPTCGADVATLERLLRESVGLAEEGAARDRSNQSQVAGLQDWISRLCVSREAPTAP